MAEVGIVTFIGAGPGDPELLTLKARRVIGEADVVIYAGSLVNPAILAYARPDAARYNSAGMPLTEQVAVMQTAVEAGQQVARLHTGDPSIYGAISEQIRALQSAGMAYRVIPGISSALAAAAALGIEYTLPDNTQTVILSRLAGRTPVPKTESLQSLAAHRSSLVLFLSAGMVERVVGELYTVGYRPDTPVAVVFRVSWPDELIIRGTLADIAEQVRSAEVTHHALIIISPALDDDARESASDSHLYGTAFAKPQAQPTPAIISLTRGGTQTGQRLQPLLSDAVLYAPARFVDGISAGVMPYDTSVRQVLQSVFAEHSALICIMSSGIVMRDLAPVLRSKHSDPAVVVLDEAGRHAISLLSGHKGGANQLAQQVADLLGGTAILTTASDVQGLPAVDLLGERYGWALEDDAGMTRLSAALVNGDSVGIVQDCGKTDWLPVPLPDHVTCYPTFQALQEVSPSITLAITYHILPGSLKETVFNLVVYRPPCLVIGVGCNRGTSAAEIQVAIEETLADAQLAIGSVGAVATIEDKADEVGLLELCMVQNWPLRIFSRDEIASVEDVPTPSPAAHKALGVWGVAEPAALLATRQDSLLVNKRKFPNVTISVALIREDTE